jgi:cysteine desulfurase / selenocysteine lyase
MSLDVAKIKSDFPIFKKSMRNGANLVYLDNGATSQKPQAVLAAEEEFYFKHNAAVHRGAHLLAEEANEAYESARATVAEFIGAPSTEIIFTKSATESLNLLAYSISNTNGFLRSDDEILVTEMEHHANLIPWQQLAKRSGAKLKWIPVTQEGRLDLSQIESLINARTKIFAVTHQSNVLGTINQLSELITKVHAQGGRVILDACQSAPHQKLDVLQLGVDAVVFSGHKMLGPTGIGILWAKIDWLESLEPFLFGGSMIESVTMAEASWAKIPNKFESGVPNAAGAVGLAAAIKYLSAIGIANINSHLEDLSKYALAKLLEIENLTLVGPKSNSDRGPVFSFLLKDIHPHDVGQVLDQDGIAVRTGHHCAWPLMKKFGLTGTTRASFYLYNSREDVDILVSGIKKTLDYFGVK